METILEDFINEIEIEIDYDLYEFLKENPDYAEIFDLKETWDD